MAEAAPEVLIIDDDEVTLVAIADLLEAAGFNTACHASPAGAADIAASHPNLVAVVLDLNMPIMRGDNVARMFLSRARLRDLPMILLSGDAPATLNAVRAKMPNLKVVAKAEMEKALVPALREAIAETARRPKRTWGSEPAVDREAEPRAKGGQAQFHAQLRQELPALRELYRGTLMGESPPLPKLVRQLQELHADAQRCASLQVGELLHGLGQVALALQHGAKLKWSTQASVQDALHALSTLTKEQGGAKLTTDAITEALRRAALER